MKYFLWFVLGFIFCGLCVWGLVQTYQIGYASGYFDGMAHKTPKVAELATFLEEHDNKEKE